MFKGQTLFFFLATILSGILSTQAGYVSYTDVALSETSDPSLGGDTLLEFLAPNLAGDSALIHTLVLNESNLDIVNFTLGADFTIFPAAFGTELNASNIESFDSVFDAAAPPHGNLGLPQGESYMGFGIGLPSIDSPWISIGWAKFDRTGDELTLLESAVHHGMPPLEGQSAGITVGVPEPSGILLMAMAALAMVRFRRR